MYAFLWWAITFYSVHCLINGCSDMVGEESAGIFVGLLIAGVISGILVPLIIFTNLKLLRLTGVRKKYYLLFTLPVFIFGLILNYYI
jgi:hypothetical protein